ncbi:hypothetical protein ACFV4N_31660 [Actinosynnema sp. NPDC059797]
MKLNAVKKSLAVLASGAALFLTLGAGCENGGDNENDDRPGVENTQDGDGDQDGDQDGGDQGDDQDGDDGN